MNVDHGMCVLAVCLCVATAQGQMSLEADYRCTGDAMMKVFEPQREVLQASSALLLGGRTEAGYGVVVSADGHVLVKASEFAELKQPELIIDRKSFKDVRLLASDRNWDVSLVKVDATGLVPVRYAPDSRVETGTWVVTNGVSSRFKRRALAGVISARARELPPLGGLVMGVVIEGKDGKLRIKELVEGGGAAKAGIQAGDELVAVDGKPLAEVKDMAEAFNGRHGGQQAAVRIRRDGREQELKVELQIRDQSFEGQSRNDMMSGDFSKRRSDFPRVLQHSILGNSRSVGGPLLDLDGLCLGMNIARANRAESFAIPVEELRELATRLMAGGDRD